MFDSLDEQIITTEGTPPTTSQRLFRFLWIAVVTLLVFGGLYLGIVSLDEVAPVKPFPSSSHEREDHDSDLNDGVGETRSTPVAWRGLWRGTRQLVWYRVLLK